MVMMWCGCLGFVLIVVWMCEMCMLMEWLKVFSFLFLIMFISWFWESIWLVFLVSVSRRLY